WTIEKQTLAAYSACFPRSPSSGAGMAMLGLETRRALIAAEPAASRLLVPSFGKDPLQAWTAVEAAHLEQARFIHQHQPCDVLIMDEGSSLGGGVADFLDLARRQEIPLVLLAESPPHPSVLPGDKAVHQWLPRELVLQYPILLANALKQAVQLAD